MKSHVVWCFIKWSLISVVLASGSKVPPRQIVYQIRPVPLSALSSQNQDGTFLLTAAADGGGEGFQLTPFGLKAQQPSIIPSVTSLSSSNSNNDSKDVDSSSINYSYSVGPSEEGSSASTNEERVEQVQVVAPAQRRILQLEPEQIQQIFQISPEQFQQIQRQQEQQQQQQLKLTSPPKPEAGTIRYELKSVEDSSPEEIKAAQSKLLFLEDRLHGAYSERREKRRRKSSKGEGQQDQQPPGDASYAFGYETMDGSRHEVADPDGNVKGWYTYVDDEGTTRKIIYTAGAGKGFVVLGKEKVKGPPRGSSSQGQQRRQKGSSRSSGGSSSKGSSRGYDNNNNNFNDLAKAGTSNPPVADYPPSRTKKPVFVVKIKRPVPKEQYFTNEFLYDPKPLPLPYTKSSNPSKSTRKRTTNKAARQKQNPGGKLTFAKNQFAFPPTISLRKFSKSARTIRNYPSPPLYYNADDDESGGSSFGYDGGSTSSGGSGQGSGSSSSDSAEDCNESNDSGTTERKGDSSYTFGYETDTANRLEKADPFGNVRGSYSYIDPEGVKRTVHYIAGGNTGYQVVHASPSIRRGVRVEAPEGFVVNRVPSSSLRTAESRYPIPVKISQTSPQPTAIVYHIHPDSTTSWTWREPVALRKKKVKIHRKKLPKQEYFEATTTTTAQLGDQGGIVFLKNSLEDFQPLSRSSAVTLNNNNNPGGSIAPNPSINSNKNSFFKEKITAAGSGTIIATETQYPMGSSNADIPVPPPPPFISSSKKRRRQHAPQRGYTAEPHLIHIDDEDEDFNKERIIHPRPYLSPHRIPKTSFPQQSEAVVTAPFQAAASEHKREPLLYSPTYETPNINTGVNTIVAQQQQQPPQPPSPVQLQPTQIVVKNKGAPAGLEQSRVMMMLMTQQQQQPEDVALATSSSNYHHNTMALKSNDAGKLHVEVPRVVIEPIIKKDENKKLINAAAPHNLQQQQHLQQQQQQKLPEAAALVQERAPPSPPQPQPQPQRLAPPAAVAKPIPKIKLVVPPTPQPNYEFSSASASSATYKFPNPQQQQQQQNHHQVSTVTVSPNASRAPKQAVPQQQQLSLNQLRGGSSNVSSTPSTKPRRKHHHHHHRSKAIVPPTLTTATAAAAASTVSIIASNSNNKALVSRSGGDANDEKLLFS